MALASAALQTQVIEKYYNGRRDVKTLDILEKEERE